MLTTRATGGARSPRLVRCPAEMRRKLFAPRRESGTYRLMHVEVLIGPQPTAKDHTLFLFSTRTIAATHGAICYSGNRVERFVICLSPPAILAKDHGAVTISTFWVEMTELMHACVRHAFVAIVHHGAALVIRDIQHEPLEIQCAPLQSSIGIAKVPIDRASIDDRFTRRQIASQIKEVDARHQGDVWMI